MKTYSPTSFLSPYDNIFLTVTIKQILSGPTGIYLLKFSNINNKVKCEMCSKLTIETTGIVLVFLLSALDIFGTLF